MQICRNLPARADFCTTEEQCECSIGENEVFYMIHARPKASAIFVIGSLMLLLGGCLTSSEEASPDNPETVIVGGNVAPLIAGNPASAVSIGQTYSFTPSASDADGDVLTFSVSNQPNWATLVPSTGTLYGTPQLGNLGLYNNIVMSVSDGTDQADLSPFSIEVVATATGFASLSWQAPTQNEDGSALSDLAGYRIYFGNGMGEYNTVIEIDNPSITAYLVENLVPNTYYFVMTSLNSTGLESNYTEVGSKTIQ
jgi:putative Ig domain-containing protein